MADTLTINTEETTAELTPEEQENLKIGEELAQEESKKLAGKYESAEELEKAYIELQKKLGDKEETSEEPKAEQEETEETEETPDASPAVALLNEANDEYFANGNQLSPETIDKFKEMSSQDLVNAYLEVIKDNPPQGNQEADVTQSQINQIQNSIGGENQYQKLMQWAGQNLPEKEINAFDGLINTGNVDAIQLGVQALKSKYEEANGYEGRMLTGKAATTADVFRSQAQLVAAMSDPRYDTDPAYRQDVVAKLERSDIDF
jgi:hypothetical protein